MKEYILQILTLRDGENKEGLSGGSDGESPGRLMSETLFSMTSLYCASLLQNKQIQFLFLGLVPVYCWPGCCWDTHGEEF